MGSGLWALGYGPWATSIKSQFFIDVDRKPNLMLTAHQLLGDSFFSL